MSSLELNTRFINGDMSHEFKVIKTEKHVYVLRGNRKIVFRLPVDNVLGHLTFIKTNDKPHGFLFPHDSLSKDSQWGYIRYLVDDNNVKSNEKVYVYYSFILSDVFIMKAVPKLSGKYRKVPDSERVYYLNDCCGSGQSFDESFSEYDVFGLPFIVSVEN